MPSNVPAKGKSLKVHNAVKLDAQDPVPGLYGGTIFTALDGSQYYPFLGGNDNLFRTLLEVRLLSPTQGNCINDKTFYSIGNGLEVKDQTFPKAFDKKINGDGQTIDDILKCVFESLYQDGNKFLEVVKTEIGGKKFVHVYAHNNMDVRFEEPKGGGKPTHVLITRHFRNDGLYTFKAEEKPRRVPLWKDNALDEPKSWIKSKNTQRTVIHIKNDVQGIDYYGLPSNFSGIHHAVLEYKAARFNLDNFENNMFLGGLLLIQGSLSTTEETKLTKNLRKMYTGEGKGQRVLPLSSEGGIQDSKFIPFNQIHEGHFVKFDERNEDKIIGCNGWSKDLLDLKNSSSLGKGGDYLKQLFKIKFHTVISPAQSIVINNFIFPLMKIIDAHMGTSFYDLPWWIKPVIPVSMEGLLDINSLLTVDEGRAELGREPLKGENGKKLIAEIKAKKPEPAPGKEEETGKEEEDE